MRGILRYYGAGGTKNLDRFGPNYAAIVARLDSPSNYRLKMADKIAIPIIHRNKTIKSAKPPPTMPVAT
jgi:hypothetical protein